MSTDKPLQWTAACRAHTRSSARAISPKKKPRGGCAAFLFLQAAELLLLRSAGRRCCRRSLVGRRGLGFLRGRRFVRAGTRENSLQRIVAFMAGIFEDPAFRGGKFVFAAPRPVPHGRILGFESIENAIRSDASEAFGNLQFLPGTAQRRGLGEVRGFNN